MSRFRNFIFKISSTSIDIQKNVQNGSYHSMVVEGRGTVFVDPCEVRKGMEDEHLYERAEKLVGSITSRN